MNLYDVFFLLGMLFGIGIFLSKVYNISKLGKWYDFSISIILFVGSYLAFFFSWIPTLLSVDNIFYMQTMKIYVWLLPINFLFLFIEIMFYFSLGVFELYKPNKTGPRK